MFYALTKNKQLIHINKAISTEQYFCPSCHALLIIKQGIKTKKHFSHIKGKHCSKHNGESINHNQAKQQIAQLIKGYYQVVIESRIYQDDQYRIADVCLPNERYIIEFQQSVISYELLKDRHNFYIDSGYHILWLLDDNLLVTKYCKIKLTRFIRSFIRVNKSYYYIITYSTSQQKVFVYFLYSNQLFHQYVKYHKVSVSIYAIIKNKINLYSPIPCLNIKHQDKVDFILQIIKYNNSIHHSLLKDMYQLRWTANDIPTYVGKIYPQQLLLGCDVIT